ncbi:MAG: PilZ domain-containing protein [Acidobacteria bacterium]|nr:PilZ domain-containing protein [Acidobacteriota bacterium]
MSFDGKSRRKRERLEISLPVRVQGRESTDYEWVEMTRLIDVTPFGAGFTITRPTESGRLLHLTLPMPRQLRCFDHIEQQYRVWALVRYVRPLANTEGGVQRYEVGVAFVGKRPPASFETDPTRRYDVAPTPTESGMYALIDKQDADLPRLPPEEARPETRHHIPTEVVVETFDDKGEVAASETTVTENLSRRGAAVFTTLDVARGRFVRITSAQYGISIIAAVRARRAGPDGITRLHLEFVDKSWPLEGID